MIETTLASKKKEYYKKLDAIGARGAIVANKKKLLNALKNRINI